MADFTQLQTIDEVINAGLWPASKKPTTEIGLSEIESMGAKLFYRGKNADLYLVPGVVPKMIMVRTDRTSVFDIPLDLQISGKGAIQNQISLFGAQFAKDFGINVLESDIEIVSQLPADLQSRCQAVEMARPIEFSFNEETVGLELIYRNFLTGSLFKAYKRGEDPYELNLEEGLSEWDEFVNPIFTPTTKGKVDLPIPSYLVRKEYPEIVSQLEDLFVAFTNHMYKKGFMVIDTKFEVFIDSEGNWALGDEVLTPESSRFIAVEKFKQGDYSSADKQIIRNYGEAQGWKKQAKSLKEGEVLHVEVPEEIQASVLAGYESIRVAMAS